nr:hypothetical protein [uncultured Kingella sp.]
MNFMGGLANCRQAAAALWLAGSAKISVCLNHGNNSQSHPTPSKPKGSLKTCLAAVVALQKRASPVFRLCLEAELTFCPRRRFAACHEQGQAPAPHAQNPFRLPKHSPRVSAA